MRRQRVHRQTFFIIRRTSRDDQAHDFRAGLPVGLPSSLATTAGQRSRDRVPSCRQEFICRTAFRIAATPTMSRHHSSMKEFHLSYAQQDQQAMPAGAVPLWSPYFDAPVAA